MENFSNYDVTTTIIICVVSVILGIILGNGLVVFFNRLPGTWFIEYGENPEDEGYEEKYSELLHPTTQRIKSTPWKYIFTGLFIVTGIYVGLDNYAYALPLLLAVFLLILMSVSDIKYMLVPDQFIMLLLLTGIGFLSVEHGSFKANLKDAGLGLAIGLGLLIILSLLSKLIYKKPGIGMADIKLYAVLGFLTGMRGIIIIFVISTFLSAAHFAILAARKKAKLTDERPMVPYIAIASFVFLVFLNL